MPDDLIRSIATVAAPQATRRAPWFALAPCRMPRAASTRSAAALALLRMPQLSRAVLALVGFRLEQGDSAIELPA